jgi:hypothetical protein
VFLISTNGQNYVTIVTILFLIYHHLTVILLTYLIISVGVILTNDNFDANNQGVTKLIIIPYSVMFYQFLLLAYE